VTVMRLTLRHGPEVGLGEEGGVSRSRREFSNENCCLLCSWHFFFVARLVLFHSKCHSITLIAELDYCVPLPGWCVTLWEVGGVMQLAFWQDMSSSTLNAIRSRRSRARLVRTAPRPSDASATHLLSICTYPLATIYA